jgi:putative flippase GtrA
MIARLTSDTTSGRFLRFLAVGVLNTAFGYAVYAVLVVTGLSPQPALAAAFALGVIWNYATHARLVFGTQGVRRLPAYVAAYVAIYAVNALALGGAIRAGVSPLVAQGVLAVLMAAISFVLISAVLTGHVPFIGALRRR